MSFSKEFVFITTSAIVAFLIRFFFIPANGVINGDGTYYAALGKRIIGGDLNGGISAYWSPLYPFLVGVSSLLFEDLEFAGRFISVVAGTLLIVPAFSLISSFYGLRAARVGTVLLIIHPFLIESSTWVMTESLYTLIFTCCLLAGWRALRGGKARLFFLTGLLLGAAYLTKPEAIGFLGLFFVLTASVKFFRRNTAFRSLARNYALLLLGFIILSLPYIFFLHQKTGRWTISQKLVSNTPIGVSGRGILKLTESGQSTLRDQLFGDVYEAETNRFAPQNSNPLPTASPPDNRAEQPFIYRALDNFVKEANEYLRAIFPFYFIFLAAIGFCLKRWTVLRIEREIYLFSFFLAALIGYAVNVIELRYLFSIIPIVIAWTARGTVELSVWTAKRAAVYQRAKRNINPVFLQLFILLILSISLLPLFYSLAKRNHQGNLPFEEKRAGLWIRNYSNQTPLIMSSHPTVAFYAGGNHLFVPDENFPTVLEYAKRKKVNFLVLTERRLKNTPQAFPDSEKNLPQELKLIYRDDRDPNYLVIIYELKID